MIYKLGKLPAKIDKRTITLKSIIRKELLPELPNAYCIDDSLGGLEDNNMYANDQYGCCVISARAHQTLRFEKFEQSKLLNISDQEVIDQYFKETGGLDMGLVLLNSLKNWRNNGWVAADKDYNIYAFASVDWKDHNEVKHCIHLLGGVNFGMLVYEKDIEQFQNGEIWHLTDNNGAYKGGHGVYLYAYNYNDVGIECMTWGKRQLMTWDFWDARLDEAYGIVDNKNDWMGNDSPVDVEKLQGYLDEITAGNEEPSNCPIAKSYVNFGNLMAKMLRRKSRLLPPIIPREDKL